MKKPNALAVGDRNWNHQAGGTRAPQEHVFLWSRCAAASPRETMTHDKVCRIVRQDILFQFAKDEPGFLVSRVNCWLCECCGEHAAKKEYVQGKTGLHTTLQHIKCDCTAAQKTVPWFSKIC